MRIVAGLAHALCGCQELWIGLHRFFPVLQVLQNRKQWWALGYEVSLRPPFPNRCVFVGKLVGCIGLLVVKQFKVNFLFDWARLSPPIATVVWLGSRRPLECEWLSACTTRTVTTADVVPTKSTLCMKVMWLLASET